MRSISSEVRGVNSDGLIIARLPAANTPASGVNVRFTGKFHGLMTPTTPFGWNWTYARAPNTVKIAGETFPRSGRIQLFRFSLANLSGAIEPETSVSSVAW